MLLLQHLFQGFDTVSVGVSGDGKYQGALYEDPEQGALCGLYQSEDYGNSFTKNSSLSDCGYKIKLSETGQYQIIESSPLHYSTDFGHSWKSAGVSGGSGPNNDIAISGNGKYQAAVINYALYESKDYGSNWQEMPSPTNGVFKGRIFLSDSGQKQVALGETNSVKTSFLSEDFGQSWQEMPIQAPDQFGEMINLLNPGFVLATFGTKDTNPTGNLLLKAIL